MKIELNDAEQRLCKYIANRRYAAARQAGVQNCKIGPQSNGDTDLNGIGAEVAFCKMFNIYPDLEVTERPNADALLSQGVSVDIKTTRYKNGHLVAAIWKRKVAADLYGLMVGTFPVYEFAGFAKSGELFASVGDLGHGKSYVLSQDQLWMIQE